MARTAPASPESVAAQVAERAARPVEKRVATEIDPDRLLNSGITLLNLACSGRIEGAFEMGDIITVPGSSSAGKTALMLTTMASAANMPLFDKHDLLFDDVESALRFDIPYLFGKKAAARIQPPAFWSTGAPRNSKTIEEVKGTILTRCSKKKPFIYCGDSLDALTCDAELDRAFKQAIEMAKEDPDKRKEIAGSYNTEKARLIHELFRIIKDEVAYNNSIVFFTQQLKQNFSNIPFAPKFRTTGGEGPFFFSSIQIWMNKQETLKKNKLKIGSLVGADVRKNKLNGILREVTFPVYYQLPGLDDVGSMVDFLIEQDFWKKKNNEYVAEGLGIQGTRPKTTGEVGTLIEQIESQNLERRLRRLVGQAWHEREESANLHRKPRFE